MPNINQQLANIYLARAFDLEKVKKSSAVKIEAILDDMSKEIIREISDVNPMGVTRTAYRQERLNKLFNMAEQTINSQYKTIAGNVNRELFTLAEIESVFAGKAINSVLGVEMADYVLSREALQALASETLIQGAPSAEWWAKQSVELQDQFKRAMRTGIAKGETLNQLAARVRGTQSPYVMGIREIVPGVTDIPIENLTKHAGIMRRAKRNAEALVRTSYQQVMSSARDEVYRKNDDVIRGTEHLSVLDGRTCWSPDTLILMADGNWKPIGEIAVGDHVIGGVSGEPCKVLAVVKNVVESSIEVCYNNKIIGRTTHGHKLLTPDGWKEAEEICLLSDIQRRQVLCRNIKAP